MREEQVGAIAGKATHLAASAEHMITVLNSFEDEAKQPFDVSKPISGTDSSVADISGRIQSVVGLIAEFGKTPSAELIPLKTLTDLENSVTKTSEAIDRLIQEVTKVVKSEGGLNSFDYSNFHLSTKSGTSRDMNSHFQSVFNESEALLIRVFSSLFILKPADAYSFQMAAHGLSAVVSDANKKLAKLNQDIQTVHDVADSLAAKEEEASDKVTAIQRSAEETARLKSDADSERQKVSEYLAEVTEHRAAVQEVDSAASSLKTSVEAYQTSFDRFQKQLDEREAKFTEGSKRLDELIGSFEDQRDGVQALIDQSEQMLSSATVSGLAANFSNMMNKLTRQLLWARVAFYVGIFFLGISALPLAAFVLLPIFAPFLENYSPEFLSAAMQYGPGSAETGWQYVGQVFARIAILLPAAWLVSFAAIRHSSLFRLREHYAYKYSMAVAVEGFKLQAPDYEQEIAALVLEELAFNPADKLVATKHIREAKAPLLAGHLFERLRQRIEQPTDK